MEPTKINTAEIGVAIRKAAGMRGVELSSDQIEGYMAALNRYRSDAVWQAIWEIYKSADQKAMPVPAVIIEQLRKVEREAIARRPLLPEPRLEPDEHQYTLKEIGICSDLLAGKIDGAEADRRTVQAAREYGQYAKIAGQDGCAGAL